MYYYIYKYNMTQNQRYLHKFISNKIFNKASAIKWKSVAVIVSSAYAFTVV